MSFAAVVTSLTRMRLAELRAAPRRGRAASSAIREGLRYVPAPPDIVLIMVIVGMSAPSA